MLTALITNWRVAVGVVAMSGAFYSGWWAHKTIINAERAIEQEQHIADANERQARAYAADKTQTDRAEKTRVITKVINQEVIRYVQLEPDRIDLPPTWRVLHDAAASNTEPSGSATRSTRPVDDATAIATVTGNYAECQRWREQVIGWQQWWAAVGDRAAEK